MRIKIKPNTEVVFIGFSSIEEVKLIPGISNGIIDVNEIKKINGAKDEIIIEKSLYMINIIVKDDSLYEIIETPRYIL